MLRKDTYEAIMPWKKEFFKNVDVFVQLGLSKEEAHKLIEDYLKMVSVSVPTHVLDTLSDLNLSVDTDTYIPFKQNIRDFMVKFLSPLLSRFKVSGLEHLEELDNLIDKFPVTLVSNHLSHFDTAAIFVSLYNAGEIGRRIAERLVFIAGRPIFHFDFTKIAVYLINSLLIFSRKDLTDHVGMADAMTRINMRSFRRSVALQKAGKIITVFPEGTRSRDGRLLKFVDAVYHYTANRLVIPVALSGTDQVLPPNSFLFKVASGSVNIGKPVWIGNLSSTKRAELPKDTLIIHTSNKSQQKQYYLDTLARLISTNLQHHQHGTYRNLYYSTFNFQAQNILIEKPAKPDKIICIIGHSRFSVAIATVLSNGNNLIYNFIINQDDVDNFNIERADITHYPLFKLPPNIIFTSNPDIILQADMIIQGAHPWTLDIYYQPLSYVLSQTSVPVINIRKGFTSSEGGLITTVLEKQYGINKNRLVVIAGANYPDEIIQRKYTGCELTALVNSSVIDNIISLFKISHFTVRPASQINDVVGMQVAGNLKNIYAMFIGLIDAYYSKFLGGHADNPLFYLSSEVFDEMVRLGVSLGGEEKTFHGLSGWNDLMLTCFGRDTRDRNYAYDLMYDKANPFKQSSGVFCLNVVCHLLDYNFDNYPILSTLYHVIKQKTSLEKEIGMLLNKLS